jgi:hypothetical protein
MLGQSVVKRTRLSVRDSVSSRLHDRAVSGAFSAGLGPRWKVGILLIA